MRTAGRRLALLTATAVSWPGFLRVPLPVLTSETSGLRLAPVGRPGACWRQGIQELVIIRSARSMPQIPPIMAKVP